MIPVSDSKLKQINEKTAKVIELQNVITNMQNGWPVGSCRLKYCIRSELSAVELLAH